MGINSLRLQILDGKKLSKQEALKMVLATFLAFVTQEDDEKQDHHCSCGHCH